MKNNESPKAIYLKDYQVPAYLITKTNLQFELENDYALVTAELSMQRNPKSDRNDCVLMGEKLELIKIEVDGATLISADYTLDETTLEILNAKQQFVLKTVAKIYPQKNSELEGLYRSSGNFCTQCEAQGFRKITWYLDRPDVLSIFTTKIIADKKQYPKMLSNGNPVDFGQLDDGRSWVTWNDPIPKPCYLFALVAGNLVAITDSFTTMSGKKVALEIYVEAHNKNKCDHAMLALKNAMKWDEDVYGREYDLDIYMIVAVDDFNMGAMENKGLNVFNSKYVLANSASATDADYQGIEAVIAHEYFHNWTGNRVTCRDWFQLSLKEGLTVFRDQEFSADMGSRAVKRIEDVRLLRARQFAEDAGPMAHPIRPESYMEINNFYTLTVYEKGAEVIRMQHSLLGKDGFRKGTDLYFKRHDGQAVTCNDFIAAMADANDFNMDQFEQWYKQAGTPEINVNEFYDTIRQTYKLTFKQSSPNTPGQSNKPALMIPMQIALITDKVEQEQLIILTEPEQSVVFKNVATHPTPSLLRGFSAPVKLNFDYYDEQLSIIMAKDTDSFNRWEAGQKLATKIILNAGADLSETTDLFLNSLAIMIDAEEDYALLAENLMLPDEITLSGLKKPIDIDALYLQRETLKKQIAIKLEPKFLSLYQRIQADLQSTNYLVDALSIAKRGLKNICLSYLVALNKPKYDQLAFNQYESANNMTDSFSALRIIVAECKQGVDDLLQHFEQKWKADPLVMDKWFALQVTQKQGDVVDVAKQLMQHDSFTMSNPNKVRSVIGAFAMSNPVQFHHKSGRGYNFVAQQVAVLDSINPQVAARMVSAFNGWKDYDKSRQNMMKQCLQGLLEKEGLSKGVFEIVSKALVVNTI